MSEQEHYCTDCVHCGQLGSSQEGWLQHCTIGDTEEKYYRNVEDDTAEDKECDKFVDASAELMQIAHG